MQFEHAYKGLKIKYSWKERLRILFKGFVQFNHQGTYDYYNHWMYFITEAHKKYGDGTKHPLTDPDKAIKTE
jgi:hypothetical protein